MNDVNPILSSNKRWPSIDAAKPEEEGGPVARSGFSFQDEVGVSLLIDMLEDETISKIHCETHDDLVIVRTSHTVRNRIAEYVQVKANEPDQLWSIAMLCKRKNNASGTSIFEVSLHRDRHDEESRFRIVTLRPVNSDLEFLTYNRGAPGRNLREEKFKRACLELERLCPGTISEKGNGPSFWLENCHWDLRFNSIEMARNANLLRLIQLGHRENHLLLPDHAETLLKELRGWVKEASDARWQSDRDKKIITRTKLRGWWEHYTTLLVEGSSIMSGGKLAGKMQDADLPDDLIRLATEMRLAYAAEARTPRYLESGQVNHLQNLVKSEIMLLRTQFLAGKFDMDGVKLNGIGFHGRCVERLYNIGIEFGSGSENYSAFMKGCMYDIVDRCSLKFERPEH
jgi:hypothetical protein